MIITIDGPAGAGKSTIARRVAKQLGFDFLDTGAMYRAVTWAALKRGVDVTDGDAVTALAAQIAYHTDGDRVFVDGRDVTEAIRSPEVSRAVSDVAAHPGVRRELVHWQREAAKGKSIVTEGRDQGTVVFPDAELKIFLTASPEERARRRVAQWREQGVEVDYEQVLEEQRRRDELDRTRPVGALQRAPDAVVIDTDGKSVEEVVEQIVDLARERTERS
ncbi:MAG TPA: (d)CMP kinase [Planctomycetaceae bacterium]|nr:(d)CMP kinase [Planctomycetaceae bacterium]